MSTVKVNELSTYSGTDISIETGKTVAGTASQFKMTDVVQGDVLYGSAADTLSRLAPGTAGQVLQTAGAGANPVWAADAGGLFSGYAVFQDQKTVNTNGGTFTSGAWRTRVLNTTVFNTDTTNIVLGTDQFTLLAGSYLIEWSAPAFLVDAHQTRLYDVTGTALVQNGTSEYSGSGDSCTTRSFGSVRVTPSGSNIYSIQHFANTTRATSGLGAACNFSAGPEVYTTVIIYKES